VTLSDLLIFNLLYQNFKIAGFDSFNYETVLYFKLSPTYYSVYNVENECIINKPYGTKLSEDELDKIVAAELRRHTAFIEQKIAEKENEV
uniref:hypothetical protein n=1 Tax=uncultured Flavobacterium sp. TaxID=165435 RepID=UPI0025DFCDDC